MVSAENSVKEKEKSVQSVLDFTFKKLEEAISQSKKAQHRPPSAVAHTPRKKAGKGQQGPGGPEDDSP